MSGVQQITTPSIQIPTHEQDPVERRRLLNILAQRRYRLRKRERLRGLDLQQQPAGLSYGSASLTTPASEPTPSTNPPYPFLSHLPHGDGSLDTADVAGANDQARENENSWSAPDIDSRISGVLGGSIVNDEDFFSSLEQQQTDQYDLPDSSYEQTNVANPSSRIINPQPQQNIAQSVATADTAPLPPVNVNPFADYAITVPGLSIVNAKICVYNHLLGPSFAFDMWNPRAMSPIFLGAEVQPCPPAFQPTALQKVVPHHPIIDVIPWPMFRERFLYTMSLPKELRPKIAQDDMPHVTMEVVMTAKDAGGGVRVWGSNAFLPENWEVGQLFFSKFWWAMDASIIRYSNVHRARRGEGPLRFDFANAIL